MPLHRKSARSRERLLWGEFIDVKVPIDGNSPDHVEQVDYDPEIQEIPQPLRQRRKSYPPRPSSKENSPSPSQSVLLLPLSSPSNPAARRPRGSDVGKSIHKAAEASRTSSRSAFQRSQDRRRSLGSAKRIVASVPPDQSSSDDDGRHNSTTLATSMARKTVPVRTSSRTRKHHLRRTPSPLDSSASTPYHVQSARKTTKAVIARPERNGGKDPTLRYQRIKAARKTSAQHAGWHNSDDSDSGSSGSSNSYRSEDLRSSSPSSSGKRLSDSDHVHALEMQMKGEVSQTVRIRDGSIRDTKHAQTVSNTQLPGISGKSFPQHLFPSHFHGVGSSTYPEEKGSRSPSLSKSIPNNPEDLNPPQALLSAFENISAYTVHLHTQKSLPFLLRNVRRGFRSWCQRLCMDAESDHVRPSTRHRGVALTFEYTDSSEAFHSYETGVPRWECPLCAIFGKFPSWEALKRHVHWDHREVELDERRGKNSPHEIESIIVRMRAQGDNNMQQTAAEGPSKSIPSRSWHNLSLSGKQTDLHEDLPSPYASSTNPHILPIEAFSDEKDSEASFTHGGDQQSAIAKAHTNRVEKSSLTRSLSHPLPESGTESKHITSSHETSESNSHQHTTPEPGAVPGVGVSQIVSLRHFSVVRSTIPSHTQLSETRSPPPPPISDPHGPSLPVTAPLGHSRPALTLLTTYRPTGPHLYDHLAPLPLDAFGHRSWFILDKEEEIFELTDVLDEDKVMCALWGRWILLNRSFFISNYLLGVEAFVSEYWLLIQQAAGWGALRAWLLMLVSRRFLKNVEMIQVLKQYNGLVGKSKWPKDTRN